MAGQPPHQQVACGQVDHCFGGRWEELVVTRQPAGPAQPRKRALHNPTAGHHLEGRDHRRLNLRWQPATPPTTVGPHHDLQPHPEGLLDLRQELSAVALIHPAVPQAGKPPPVHPTQQPHRAVTVADIGRGHVGLADQPQRVDQQVPLAAVYLLGPVEAVRPPFSVVFTLWLSSTAALGVGLRP
jgi:hypothetical protein